MRGAAGALAQQQLFRCGAQRTALTRRVVAENCGELVVALWRQGMGLRVRFVIVNSRQTRNMLPKEKGVFPQTPFLQFHIMCV